ncbi:SUMF1/EgtB/PvdO family nonheme iron enzyme [Sphingopyxis indica]|uniref:Formylglycine-generating enzyme, required for sulfatase activity, contains SUMF1/FGE domain n=1 Tax=Sphingopyxis indica TaxID=436663 RepID=A0A239I7B6_9SPHN|nr:SUMF1/EgtB/PvdO family nonheme iron enzyme [Sphingopyxis indica]WOF42427.1 SUMF1/EgtB/PvdO family nonheme iron enzyme [Sphingopyxis indica]SNS89371.1 Formylglycine-generating enzyme, required for sulfatase activity, contains SUMF1/FGE domain [Sphingopyxis indica]
MKLPFAKAFASGSAIVVTALLASLSSGPATPPVSTCAGKPGQVHVPAAGPNGSGGSAPAGRAFLIDRTEVTVAQFEAFVKATGYRTHAERVGWSAVFHRRSDAARLTGNWWVAVLGADWRHPLGPGQPEASRCEPVTQVTYDDALAFAKWAGRDLPTDVEWERAATGGDSASTSSLKWAYAVDGTPLANTWQGLFPDFNTAEDGFAGVAPVGSFPPNRYGLYDMIGNVWELTRSVADGTPVLKGGSYLCSFNACANFRPSAAVPQETEIATSHVGFRTVRRERLPHGQSQPSGD